MRPSAAESSWVSSAWASSAWCSVLGCNGGSRTGGRTAHREGRYGLSVLLAVGRFRIYSRHRRPARSQSADRSACRSAGWWTTGSTLSYEELIAMPATHLSAISSA